VCLVRVPQARVHLCAEPAASQEEGRRRRQERLTQRYKEEVRLTFLTTARQVVFLDLASTCQVVVLSAMPLSSVLAGSRAHV
jgi:hypothetical protein